MSQASKEVVVTSEAKEGEVVPTVEQFATREAKLTLQKHTELTLGRLPIWAELARAYPVLVSTNVSEEEAISNQAALNTYNAEYKRQLYLAFGLGEPKLGDNVAVMRKGIEENRKISESTVKVYISETKRVISALANPATYEHALAAIDHCIERKLGKTALFKALPALDEAKSAAAKERQARQAEAKVEAKPEGKAEQKPETKPATVAKLAEAAFKAKATDPKATPTEAILAYVTAEGKSDINDTDEVLKQYRHLSTIIQSTVANLANVMRKLHVSGSEGTIQDVEQQFYKLLSKLDAIADVAVQQHRGNTVQQQDEPESEEAETEEEALEKLGLTGTDSE